MMNFPNMYITEILPRSLRGIVQEGSRWVDITTREPVSFKKAKEAQLTAIVVAYPGTDPVAFEQKIERYRKLALSIKDAIEQYKANGGKNENAFSIHATYEDGEFSAVCVFYEGCEMTIIHERNRNNPRVQRLYDTDSDAIQRLARLMINENWITEV